MVFTRGVVESAYGPMWPGASGFDGLAVLQFGQVNVPRRMEDLTQNRLTCLNVIAHLDGRADVPVLEGATAVRVDLDPVGRDDPDDA